MLKLLLGDPNARKLKRYQPLVSDINLLEEEIAPLSDEELRGLTSEFRQKLANGAAAGAGPRRSQPARRPCSMSCCPRPLPWCAKPASGCWACATSMCS